MCGPQIYALSIGVGALGTAFHLYNVTKRVGGARLENFFYGAPVGAPAALALAGLSGLAADRLAGNARRHGRPTLIGLPAGRVVAALSSLGLLGTVGEAGLLHFRGDFQNPAMYLPVTMPPVAAAFLAEAALAPAYRPRRVARVWPGLVSLMGFAGSAFHAYGVQRMAKLAAKPARRSAHSGRRVVLPADRSLKRAGQPWQRYALTPDDIGSSDKVMSRRHHFALFYYNLKIM